MSPQPQPGGRSPEGTIQGLHNLLLGALVIKNSLSPTGFIITAGEACGPGTYVYIINPKGLNTL